MSRTSPSASKNGGAHLREPGSTLAEQREKLMNRRSSVLAATTSVSRRGVPGLAPLLLPAMGRPLLVSFV